MIDLTLMSSPSEKSIEDRIVVQICSRFILRLVPSVYKDVHLRYLRFDSADGALVSIKECLLNPANIFKEDRIVVSMKVHLVQ